MSRRLVLLVSFGIALLACSRCGQARVGLNSVSTEILGDGDALPMNRSAWEPKADLTVSVLPPCVSQAETRRVGHKSHQVCGFKSIKAQICVSHNLKFHLMGTLLTSRQMSQKCIFIIQCIVNFIDQTITMSQNSLKLYWRLNFNCIKNVS